MFDRPRLVDRYAVDTDTFTDEQMEQFLRLARLIPWRNRAEDDATMLDLVEKQFRRAQKAEQALAAVKQESEDLLRSYEKPASLTLLWADPKTTEDLSFSIIMSELRDSQLMNLTPYSDLVDFMEKLYAAFVEQVEAHQIAQQEFEEVSDELATVQAELKEKSK